MSVVQGLGEINHWLRAATGLAWDVDLALRTHIRLPINTHNPSSHVLFLHLIHHHSHVHIKKHTKKYFKNK